MDANYLKIDIKNLEEFNSTFPDLYNLYFPKLPKQPDNNIEFDILMKILPEPASRIYKGVKKYELRKYVPRHSGLIFLLETGMINAITGCFLFKSYISDTVENIWRKVGKKATTKSRFDQYFANKQFGVALEIIDHEIFEEPIPISELYDQFPDIPQLPHPVVYLYSYKGSIISDYLREKAKALIERNSLDG